MDKNHKTFKDVKAGMPNELFEKWERGRKFIAKAINKDGTILDIGCSTGLLLKCLQEWSNHKLIPYGIDIDSKCIRQARKLFLLHPNNFIVKNAHNLSESPEYGFPAKFDFIYWNIWNRGKWNFEDQRNVSALKIALKRVSDKGRLMIFGYHESDKEKIRRIKKIEKSGFKPFKILKNPIGNEFIAWVDKSSIRDK